MTRNGRRDELAEGLSVPLGYAPELSTFRGPAAEEPTTEELPEVLEPEPEPPPVFAARTPEPIPEDPPSPDQRSAIVEAILFASAAPVRTSDLQEACGWPLPMLNRDLDRLNRELRDRGLELQKVAGAWRLVTAAETAPWVERYLKIQSRKQLTRAQLETLAVVAYRQPVSRAEVDAYRGVRSERTLHQLAEMRLIREVGRAETPGRPFQYGTGADFLRYFGLDRIEELPAVERGGIHFRRHRGPFRATEGEDEALAAEVAEALAEAGPEAMEVLDELQGEPSPEATGPSPGLMKLLNRIKRKESRDDLPAVRRGRSTEELPAVEEAEPE